MAQAGTIESRFGPYGEQSALLVIDVQNGVVANAWDRDGVLERLAALIDRARASDVPVVYVQHETPDDDNLRPGTDRWQIHARIAPNDGEPIVAKRYGDAFVETTLPETLRSLDAGHLIIAGAQTDACVRATTHRAMGLGYDVTLVADCHTTDDFDWDGVQVSAEQLIGHFNLAIRYSEYPGQRIAVVPEAAVELRHPAATR
jgi:nicotinamidase-related amidase